MWIGKFLVLAAAGMVGANAVPHFVKGIIGSRHQSPFGKPSSAVVNVIWGSANLVGALWLGILGCHYRISVGPGGTVAIGGALIMGVALAVNWQRDPITRGEGPSDAVA